ncbi:MAG TPA: thioredoxin [Allocoleopsis sp.]
MAVKKQFNSFDELINNSDKPVLVDFYATWCGPCHLMADILNEVHSYIGDKITIVKIDSDKYTELASKHHIVALPTLLLFKNGQRVDRIEGVLKAPDLIQRLTAAI